MLGDRAQPEKKKKKRKKSGTDSELSHSGATAMEPESDREEEDDWSLEQAIRYVMGCENFLKKLGLFTVQALSVYERKGGVPVSFQVYRVPFPYR